MTDFYSPEYRVIQTVRSPGNPNIILVHGAVIPLPITLHRIDQSNNCFSQLESLLVRHRCNYNVWSFEYADELVPGLPEPGYVNYGCLSTYGYRLIQAIRWARDQTQNFTPVNIIAHSMGGLIARYAAQNIRSKDGSVNTIITLDTGHLGFELAKIVDDLVVSHLPTYTTRPICCSVDANPTSTFMQNLTTGFPNRTHELVSLAAQDELPLGPSPLPPIPGASIRVVPWPSSTMGQVNDHGDHIPSNYHIPYDIRPHCDHLTISLINSENHPAFDKIRQILCHH